MDLDEAAAVLYAGSPDDFIARRTALVAQAKAAKDRELAKAIGGLRRPTRAAWLVNLLARQAPENLAQLLELGDALREAQSSLAGDELRRLSGERSRVVSALARRAAALGAEQGYAAGDGAVQEVASTLQAALADPGVAAEVRTGRVAAAATYSGFGPMDWAMPPQPARDPSPEPVEGSAPEPLDEPDPEQERRRAEAEAAWEQARRELEEAEAAAERATTRADELAEALEDLRQQVRDTETAEREAREAARAARKALVPAREAAARAQRRRDEVLAEY